MKRLMTALVVVLVVSATALPAVGACCVAKPAGMASMHASMPCCAEGCRMKAAETSSVRDEAIAPASSSLQPAPVVSTAVVTDAYMAAAETACANDPFAIDSSPPASFLLHSQFRI